MKRLAAVLLLVLAHPAIHAQTIQLPATLTTPPGIVEVAPAKLDADSVAYLTLDPGLAPLPSCVQPTDPTHGVFLGLTPGTFRVIAVAGKVVNGKVNLATATCAVTVGQPPAPPGPPQPTDLFTQALQAAYAQETDPNKAQEVQFLAAVFQGAPAKVTAGMTAGQLFSVLSQAIHGASKDKVRTFLQDNRKVSFSALLGSASPKLGIPVGALPKVMAVIGNDLDAAVGGKPGSVDPATPVPVALVQASFAKYAAALANLH